MWNVRRGVKLALAGLVLAGLVLAGCGDPNVRSQPVPSAEKLRAADCAPALTTYRQLLQLPPRVGMVVTNRSAPARSVEAQERAAQAFASQCATAFAGKVRRAIVRCWLDSPDTETFQNCSQRF